MAPGLARRSGAAALVLALLPFARADRLRLPCQASAVGHANEAAVAELLREAAAALDGRLGSRELLKAAAAEPGDLPRVEEVLSRRFTLADGDGDMSLDPLEAEGVVGLVHRSGSARQQGEGRPEAEGVMADAVRALGSDGYIGLGALLQAAEAEGQPGLAALVEQAFAEADADMDGSLDRAELERFMELMGEHHPAPAAAPGAHEQSEADEELADVGARASRGAARVASMFRRMDMGADGEIDLQEFLDVAEEEGARNKSMMDWAVLQFGTADASADGRLDAREAGRFVELSDDAPEYGFFVDPSSSDDDF